MTRWMVVGSVVALAVAMWLTGCNAPPAPPAPNGNTNANDNGTGGDTARTCVGCHTDETLLKAVAREEPPPPEDTGEG